MSLLRWIVGIWILLFFLFLPFPFELLPDFEGFLSTLFFPLTEIVSDLPAETLRKTFGFSDSIHLYVQSIALLILAVPIAFFCEKSKRKQTLQKYLLLSISFILSFFLLKYGIEKLTRLQFPAPAPNLLYTPLGELDKDILFWSTMGTSSAYAWFMGIVEIATTIFLLFVRTRILGALISFGIFLNIFALNIGFDISVKVLSFALIAGSLFLIAPYFSQTIQFLTGGHPSRLDVQPLQFKNETTKRILKGSVIALLALECTIPAIRRVEMPFEDKTVGTYEVIQVEGNFKSNQLKNLRRIHLHRDGYVILESKTGKFESHKNLKTNQKSSYSLNDGTSISISREEKKWYFELDGNEDGKLTCKKRDNAGLPLLQDNFHWTVEGMMESK